jgi:polar amino acid transport system ATP-binding protein
MKLRLYNVHKSFAERKVLAGLNLEVNAGEVVSFIGSSGSGKTTLLRCVNLLEPIDDGAIFLEDDEISQLGRDPNPIRRRIGIVFQSFNLFPHMSVRRNITLALTQVVKKSVDDANEIAISLLKRFGLDEKIDSYPDQLSGGQQKLVALGRALMIGTNLLLLDEPFEGVAPALAQRLAEVISQLKAEGMSVLFSESDLQYSEKLVQNIFVIDRGILSHKKSS